MTEQPYQRTDGPIHGWFGLSYTNYQVLHRTLMQSMPTAWQERMVACLEELAAAYSHIEQPEVFDVQAGTEHIVNEMSGDELAQAGIEWDWYGGKTPPKGLTDDEFAEWCAENETEAPVYYRDGGELDPHQRVLLPAADPIPHYRHAYIEPRLPEEQPAAEDTLPAWLAQRFDPRGPEWDALADDDRTYWEHHAAAVRRAVARGGFKAAEGAQR